MFGYQSKKPQAVCCGKRLIIDAPKAKPAALVVLAIKDVPVTTIHIRKHEDGAILGYTDTGGAFQKLADFVEFEEAEKTLQAIRQCLFFWPNMIGLVFNTLVVLLTATVFLFSLNALLGLGANGSGQAPRMAITSDNEDAQTSPEIPAGVPIDIEEQFKNRE